MTFKVVIPARFGSTRLPGKPLLDIGGKPMIQWVVETALGSQAEQIIVATDDMRIATVVTSFCDAACIHNRVAVAITRADHNTGTDRLAEVAQQQQWSPATVVVNVQGDEPELPAALIDQVATLLLRTPQAQIASLCTAIDSLAEFLNPNVVKVVRAANGMALYFSRAPIPWHRDTGGALSQTQFTGAYRHLGLYAYRVEALLNLTALPASLLELTEKLEQLRALQAGMQIVLADACVLPGIGVDTECDIDRVRRTVSAIGSLQKPG